MSRDYLAIGPTPAGEDCAQVGSPGYLEHIIQQCNRFIALIKDVCGEPPEGACLRWKSFPHDFGDYHEVVVWFDNSLPESVDYAYHVDAHAPQTWDDKEPNLWVAGGVAA